MKKKITRAKCILLDAMIIITAHKQGIWLPLVDAFKIMVPSIIARDEALFYSEKEGGIPKEINLSDLITKEKITELTATVDELKNLSDLFESKHSSSSRMAWFSNKNWNRDNFLNRLRR